MASTPGIEPGRHWWPGGEHSHHCAIPASHVQLAVSLFLLFQISEQYSVLMQY